jgi:hypothetical protein
MVARPPALTPVLAFMTTPLAVWIDTSAPAGSDFGFESHVASAIFGMVAGFTSMLPLSAVVNSANKGPTKRHREHEGGSEKPGHYFSPGHSISV